MGRTPPDSLPGSELEINVQPRRHHHHNHPPPLPSPPRPYRPFKKWFPWLVPLIILVNIGLFAYVMYVNDCPVNSEKCFGSDFLGRFAFQSLHENPLLGPSADTLRKLGALEMEKVVKDHQVWRLFSCMWLHAGVFHVAANMVSLLCVGIRLEQEFGFVKIGLLYILSGMGGSLASALFVRMTISVGASGALFGLLGAMLSELLTNWTIYENKLATLLTLILIILINLAVGVLPHVDNFAHLGGFLTGFLLGFILLIRPQFGYVKQRNAPPGYFLPSRKAKHKVYQCFLLIFALLILILGLTVGMVMLLQGVDGNDHCSWCHYLSCFPTPIWTCDARCSSNQIGDQLNLTCMLDNKSSNYYLSSANNTASDIQKLCTQLCS
ncbi:unnamed protein product [Cuscuta europaea]|uniref:RHOMBOID-like protein n=1 Tax=Cuscuta europaea TaxID=41803 RepID=A0A9P0YRU7_CUSEU|nr:unnamed protein product [Cuscuta europaea]